jgi:hypothetical protein
MEEKERRSMKRIIPLMIIFMFIGLWQEVYSGEAATFLRINPSPRSTSLGGVSCALAGTPYGTYLNPASLTDVKGSFSVSLMYARWIADLNHTFLGVAKRINKRTVIGVSGYGIYVGDLVRTQDDYQVAFASSESFSSLDGCLGLSVSRKITEKTSIGGTLKGIYQRIDDENAQGVAFDLGVLYRMKNGSIGATIKHLGPKISLSSSQNSFPLPMEVSAGVGLVPTQHISIFGDIKWGGGKISLHGGFEVICYEILKGRVGYRYLIGNEKYNVLSGMTAGLGLELPGGISIDISYVPYRDLGDSLRVSIGF